MHFNWLAITSCIFATVAFAAPSVNKEIPVLLRIEGKEKTIFEGRVLTRGHNVTTASGGTHHCDGTNNHENSKPGATCTSALDDASKKHNFTFDGTFDPQFDDFFITRIGNSNETATEFWGILVNFTFTPVGGCQQEVTTTDEVLFAFDAFSKANFLKLSGPHKADVSTPVNFTVTDGTSGAPVAGADVHGQTSGADGKVSVTFAESGRKAVKASKSDSIRSNRIEVLVV
ncbi:hypothetical protein BDZ97DRAFT_1650233 [Flammula alnicola]|nr:hypothetical protein BDZ97DRAFT_1650233 [Flammula alnicola]